MGQPMSSPSIGAPTTSRGGRRTPLLAHSGWSFSRTMGFRLEPIGHLVGATPTSISLVGYLRSLLAGFATGVCVAVLIWHLL